MKKSKNAYDIFDGRLSDGKKSVRLYGFDEAVQQKLLDHKYSGGSVLLTNCEVKQKEGLVCEVQVKTYTDVQASSKFAIGSGGSKSEVIIHCVRLLSNFATSV